MELGRAARANAADRQRRCGHRGGGAEQHPQADAALSLRRQCRCEVSAASERRDVALELRAKRSRQAERNQAS